jgi:uncharacterized membrane protein
MTRDATTASPAASSRIQSIDLLRGAVMIIMTLDHVRDYFHADAFIYQATDLSRTTLTIFFTRWITHFCAPVFMLLAGTSAFLIGQRKSKSELAIFLLKRGIWLVILDLVIVNFAWTFDTSYHSVLFNVISVFGVGMIVMALLIYLPIKMIFAFGLVTIAAHNTLDNVIVAGDTLGVFLWSLLHRESAFPFGERTFFVGYPIIPWVGVMALGYCLGYIYTNRFNIERRTRILIGTGSIAILVFVVLRATNVYGDSSQWSTQSSRIFTALSFIKTSKYPPSLLFLLMTLGPSLLFLAFAERVRGKLVDAISVYGRVPLFYYVIHIYFIHLLAMFAAELTPGFSWSDMVLNTLPWNASELKGYGFPLGVVYFLWAFVVIALYPLCKWYCKYKLKHKEKEWLSYL